MTTAQPRLRMFAGPNGSGKSTLKKVLPEKLLGVYLNADELEQLIRERGRLQFSGFEIQRDQSLPESIGQFLRESTLLKLAGLTSTVDSINATPDFVDFSRVEVNSYVASVIADFLRRCLLKQHSSFTMETVMSSVDKVCLLEEAQSRGYRTYLYFIATDDPTINVSRVLNRVRMGGHPVPEEKIVSRYVRSLDFLIPAVRHTNRAYIFDNSADGRESTLIAEITDGKLVEIKSPQIPEWFRTAMLAKIRS